MNLALLDLMDTLIKPLYKMASEAEPESYDQDVYMDAADALSDARDHYVDKFNGN